MSETLTTLASELEAGRPVVAFPTGVSMEPLLKEGRCHVVVAPLAGPPEVGDIVLARLEPGRYLLHRVIARTGQSCTTRGDNALGTEELDRSQVLGRVEEIVREDGTLVRGDRAWEAYGRRLRLMGPIRRSGKRLAALFGAGR